MRILLFRKKEINSLNTRIAELEEENKKLSLMLEKKDEKIRKSIASEQEAYRELNVCKKKLSTLENEVQKLKKEAIYKPKFRFSEILPKNRFDEVIYSLNSIESNTSSFLTIYLATEETIENIPENIRAMMDSDALYLVERIESSTGKVIFYADNLIRVVFIPIFPIIKSEYIVDYHFHTYALKHNIRNKAMVINAHAGETFVGVMQNENFVEHEIIRSSVMGRHSKGGFSQKRFERLIEEDVKHHADKVRDIITQMLEKHDVKYFIAGGEAKLIKMILKEYKPIVKSMAQVVKVEKMLKEILAIRWYGI